MVYYVIGMLIMSVFLILTWTWGGGAPLSLGSLGDLLSTSMDKDSPRSGTCLDSTTADPASGTTLAWHASRTKQADASYCITQHTIVDLDSFCRTSLLSATSPVYRRGRKCRF